MVSILLWASSVPVSRIVLEGFGFLSGTAITLLAAGLFLLGLTTWRNGGLGWVRRLRWPHLSLCGPLFVGYMLLLYAAVGLAASRDQAIVAGLANYLWPALILVFSVVILRIRVRRIGLAVGILACLAGVVLAASGDLGGWDGMARALSEASRALALGAGAAVCWGLYSVLARVFEQTESSGAIGLLLVATAGAAVALGGGPLPATGVGWREVAAAAYMALLPNSLAYWLWDEAMRDGSVPTLGALANAIPILSTALGTLVLGLSFRVELLAGAGLVTVGAAVSRLSFRSGTSPGDARPPEATAGPSETPS